MNDGPGREHSKGPGSNNYKPALAYDWLTGLYDPVMRLTMREDAFKSELVRQAAISDGFQVLDLGCGTATLTALVKQQHPGASVVGLDGDPTALRIAQEKVGRMKSGLDIKFVHGLSYDMPFGPQSFDRVVSSLLFHHLSTQDKMRTLRDVRRVLKPAGELHIADWGMPQNALMRAAFLLVQLLDGFDTTTDNVRGLLPQFLREAGLIEVEESARYTTMFGTISLYRARNP